MTRKLSRLGCHFILRSHLKLVSGSMNSEEYKNDMSRIVRKLAFCICEKRDADQMRSNCAAEITAQLISAFVFATRIEHSLYYLNPKFQASSRLLRLYSPVCVDPGRKPRSPVFSQRCSYYIA